MKKLVVLIIILVGIGIAGFLVSKGTSKNTSPSPTSASSQPSSTDSPRIVSTKPEPLEEAIVSATEVIEITFNRSLENVGEFKSRIDPKIEYKVELSSDRKTAKITPSKPLELGATYTLFIGPDTKFDGVGNWGEEKIFHFKTIKYRGI